MKPVNFAALKNTFVFFLVLNLFTIPLSPYAGGHLSKSAYAPILTAKMFILGGFAIVSFVMVMMHIKFLIEQKKSSK